jgi:hypothetical protein
MIPKYTIKEFNDAKSKHFLKLQCTQCNCTFKRTKKIISRAINTPQYGELNFCSRKCQGASKLKEKEVICKNCSKNFIKKECQIKKSNNNFCSRSCSVTYKNLNKNYGNKRSKLEDFLEKELIISFPSLQFLFNDKTTINSELDIYIPSLKLAFELNGIFHYEPIFGPEKLNQIQNNDKRKFQACLEHEIELVLIDVSSMKHFKPKNAIKFYNIIIDIIKFKLNSFQ